MIAILALLVAHRAMSGVEALRSARVDPAARPGTPAAAARAPDLARSAAELDDLKAGRVPAEVLAAWVQFLRDEVADAANGLHNRLQVVEAARRELVAADDLRPDAAARLADIERETERMAAIARSLQRRVSAFAPDTVPEAVAEWDERPARPGHVLVVEDDAANRHVIARVLERYGHKVTTVANGIEAFQVIEQTLGAVDCIVCDLRMPSLGGRPLFEQIEERWPPLVRRFVFVTGDYTRPESRAFLEASGQPVIGKPFELTELMNAVRQTLRARPSTESS